MTAQHASAGFVLVDDTLTTPVYPIVIELPDGRLRHIVQVMARLENGTVDIRSTILFLDVSDLDPELGPQPSPYGYRLDIHELDFVRAEIEAMHARQNREPDPLRCVECGAELGEFCADACSLWMPF